MGAAVQTITTQDEFYQAGLLSLRDALDRAGWEWRVETHGRTVFIRLEAVTTKVAPIHFGPLVTAFESADFDRLFCYAHDGSGRTSPSCCEYVFLRYPT